MARIDPHIDDRQTGRGHKLHVPGPLAGPARGLAIVLGVIAFVVFYCVVNVAACGYRLFAAVAHRFGTRRN